MYTQSKNTGGNVDPTQQDLSFQFKSPRLDTDASEIWYQPQFGTLTLESAAVRGSETYNPVDRAGTSHFCFNSVFCISFLSPNLMLIDVGDIYQYWPAGGSSLTKRERRLAAAVVEEVALFLKRKNCETLSH